jgi:uncharacterized protein (UPF0332 family)
VYYGGIPIDFNWKTYLDLAKELEKGTDEARLRSSISRAYYAAYCSARNCMEDVCGRQLPFDEPSHQYVIEYYNGNKGVRTNPRRAKIAQNLMRMRERRKMADYDDKTHTELTLHNFAQFVLAQSEEVIASIERGGL